MSATAFDQRHLETGDGHTLHVAQYGKPDAPAAVVLHGGPGSGTQPSVLDWFDLNSQRVVLFDQRGAGLSQPHGEIHHNDSHKLVADIELLRTTLGISSWMVVGGSWGATLALLYAGMHRQHVQSLVLRGSFLASSREMQWFFQSLSAMVPEAWQGLTHGWSADEKADVLRKLCNMLLEGDAQAAQDAAMRWSLYEEDIMRAMAGTAPREPGSQHASPSPRTLGKYRLQAHYLSHQCFTSEDALLRIAGSLNGMRCTIIHGAHDLVCPPENAMRLKHFMPHARLHWVSKGSHTPADPLIAKALTDAIREHALASQ